MKTFRGFEDIPDLSGRTALVTGANSGLGYHTALMLARRGAEVILACRSLVNAERAITAMREAYPLENLRFTTPGSLDLADLSSVTEFARRVCDKYSRLDIVVNNAGVMVPPLTRTRQGFELQFGVNHLGHFALTGRLMPLIVKTPGARIVSLSSVAAWSGGIDFEDPNYQRRRYGRWRAYGASKLANQMFVQELARRLAAGGADVVAVSAHPGISATDLFKNSATGAWFARNFSQSPHQGALPVLYAASARDINGGSYWGPGGFMELSGPPAPARIPPKALDADSCRRLWELSERLTGTNY